MSQEAPAREPVDQEFQSLLQRARNGDPEACNELYRRFRDPVERVVRRHLEVRLRPVQTHYSWEDCLQSAWTEVFAGSLIQADFASPTKMVAFILEVTRHNLCKVLRRHLHTQKRNPGEQSDLDPDLPDPRPQPDQVAAERDELAAVLRTFPPEWQQALLMLGLGHLQGDVAAYLGISVRQFQRRLASLRQTKRYLVRKGAKARMANCPDADVLPLGTEGPGCTRRAG
jgi:RNA polymerase sigma factor (sigma-70 family)